MPANRHSRAPRRYTWNDYQTWPECERWEIIDGVAYDMCPAPPTRHQAVAGNCFGILFGKLAGKPCRPFTAPTDVKFSDYDVVQPDVLVVCDPVRITPTHIEGAPDLVVEVLSPSTTPKDLREKFDLYQRGGVREYLAVNPVENYLHRFKLGENGRFGVPEIFTGSDLLTLASLEGVEIRLWEVFELPEPATPGPVPAGKGPEEWRS